MSAISHWQQFRQNAFESLNTTLTSLQTLQTQINTVTASSQPTYTISDPAGSQTVDKNGYLSVLLSELETLMHLYERQYEICSKFPYWQVAKGV